MPRRKTFTPYTATMTCPNGHTYPSVAGVCPECPTPRVIPRQVMPPTVGARPMPTFLARWFSLYVKDLTNQGAKQSVLDFGYSNRKLGLVNHIPVCRTLKQLDDYFLSDAAQGSTNWGNGRDKFTDLPVDGKLVPISELHCYVKPTGPQWPWAQGIIQTSAACQWQPAPLIRGMRSGEPNHAFGSVENVAMVGTDGLTDPQFNVNAMLRAHHALTNDYEITPDTQIWHAEIDQRDRCFDPGWGTALEQQLQDAAKAVMVGDISLLRGVVDDPTKPEPQPQPVVTESDLARGLAMKVLLFTPVSLTQARDDINKILEAQNG